MSLAALAESGWRGRAWKRKCRYWKSSKRNYNHWYHDNLPNSLKVDCGHHHRGKNSNSSNRDNCQTTKPTNTREVCLFCSVILNAQHRNVQEGISVYSSWEEVASHTGLVCDPKREKQRETHASWPAWLRPNKPNQHNIIQSHNQCRPNRPNRSKGTNKIIQQVQSSYQRRHQDDQCP